MGNLTLLIYLPGSHFCPCEAFLHIFTFTLGSAFFILCLQLLAAEVQEDAFHIFTMVLKISEFERALADITHDKVAVVIDEALDILYHGPEPTEKANLLVHTDALMVIAVLMQWLVNYLCKRLMQLVPPEAIPVHCSGIPTVYIRNYLVFQEHFSLKELIEWQLLQLLGNDWLVSAIIILIYVLCRS